MLTNPCRRLLCISSTFLSCKPSRKINEFSTRVRFQAQKSNQNRTFCSSHGVKEFLRKITLILIASAVSVWTKHVILEKLYDFENRLEDKRVLIFWLPIFDQCEFLCTQQTRQAKQTKRFIPVFEHGVGQYYAVVPRKRLIAKWKKYILWEKLTFFLWVSIWLLSILYCYALQNNQH